MATQKKPLISSIFTADPSARVFDGKLYIYPSHDLPHSGADNDNGDEYAMEDYHVLSLDSLDAECVDNGEAIHMKDIPWVSKQLWAPDCISKNGKYYLVYPARDHEGLFRLGVAISDSPVGPFKAEPNYIEGSYSIDPGVLQDDDGKVYVYYGGLWGGQLDKWRTGEFDPTAGELEGNYDPEAIAQGPMFAEFSEDMKSFVTKPVNLTIYDKDGTPLKCKDEDKRFFESSWVHKYNGKYYLSYSTGTTHYIVYATSDSPAGPFTYQGRVLEPVLGWTTHQSIVEYEGKWYLFYHDCEISRGVNHRRNVKFMELTHREDGSIVTLTDCVEA